MGGVEVLNGGVSGGTVASTTGFYDDWILSLSALDYEALQLIKRRRFIDFWKKINGPFLITVLAGIGTGFLTLAHAMRFFRDQYPIHTNAFFFGVILIVAPLTLRKVRKWNAGTGLTLLLGATVGFCLTITPPLQTPDNLALVFLCGIFAAAGVIWPGVSGTFVLLLIGKYQYLLFALSTLNITILAFFVVGWMAGILAFAQMVRPLVEKHHHLAVALLAGLMIGALNKLWPWRFALEFVTNSKGKQVPAFDKSILPWDLLTQTGKDPQVLQAILMMALGVFIVVLTEKIAERLKTKF